MDAFDPHCHLFEDYFDCTRGFVCIADARINKMVDEEIAKRLLLPDSLLQFNPAFEPGRSIDELVLNGVLRGDCAKIYRTKMCETYFGRPMRLHLNQGQAIQIAVDTEISE